MTDAEFVEAVLTLRVRPATELEERYHNVQCAQDFDHVWMDRLDRIIRRYRLERDD